MTGQLGQFKCDVCDGTFDCSEGNAEKAEAEMLSIWGNIAESERSIICDDCFERGKALGVVPSPVKEKA